MTCWMTWIVRMSPRCHYEIRVRNGSLWFRMTRVSLATNLMERRVCFGMWLHVRTCWFKFQGWPPMSEIFSKKTCLFSHDSIVWWCLKGLIAAQCSCIMLMCSLIWFMMFDVDAPARNVWRIEMYSPFVDNPTMLCSYQDKSRSFRLVGPERECFDHVEHRMCWGGLRLCGALRKKTLRSWRFQGSKVPDHPVWLSHVVTVWTDMKRPFASICYHFWNSHESVETVKAWWFFDATGSRASKRDGLYVRRTAMAMAVGLLALPLPVLPSEPRVSRRNAQSQRSRGSLGNDRNDARWCRS